jgi:hypothetical protein
MAKQDMNMMVESFFAKKENLLSESFLEELVRNQFKKLMTEQDVVKQAPRAMTLKYSAIPEIAVTEIGWSAVETKVTGETISSPQRKQLEDYLKNIKGASLQEKIATINKFYNSSMEELQAEGIITSDSRTSKIQKIISYLVFLKTLTTIITNFNAASAGFSFEAFLGVLLGGKQVPTASGTIADMIAGDGKYISLKLYAEQGVEVGGSFTDLVNDLTNPSRGKIYYVIAMKDLQGEALEREGKITVLEFFFDMDNVMSYMSLASKHSKKCIQLPKAFIASKGKADFSKLKKTVKPKEEIEKEFNKVFQKTFKTTGAFSARLKELLDQKEGTDGFYPAASKGELGLAVPTITSVEKAIFGIMPEYPGYNQKKADKDQKQLTKTVAKQVVQAYEEIMGFAKGTNLEQTAELAGIQSTLDAGGGFADPESSMAFYNSLKNPKQKALALKNTFGYLNVEQFSITKGQLMKFGAGVQNLGEIIVGRRGIERMINEMSTAINQEVFEIFDSLNVLTSNINSYFATGLKDDSMADQAQEAALNIDKKTEEIQAQARG